MKTQIKRTAILATAISLILASSFAMATDSTIKFEEASNNGTNSAVIDASGASGATIRIYQVGTDTGNKVGEATADVNDHLTVSGASTINIGQGASFNPAGAGTFGEVGSVSGNVVKGSVSGGTVNVTQQASNGLVILNKSSTGTTTINQGGATVATAGDIKAEVTQSTGTVVINQGMGVGSKATKGLVKVNHSSTGTTNVTQDTTDEALTDTGSVDITNADTGEVYTNTSGGTLTVNQSSSGETYVNAAGTPAVGNAGMTGGTANLINSGTGTVKLMANGVDGTVNTNASGGNLNITQTGTGTINVKDGASAGMTGGDVTINNSGTTNVVAVKGVTSGTLNIDQKVSSESATATVNAMTGGTLNLNQYGTDQKVTVASYGGSTTTINQGAGGSSSFVIGGVNSADNSELTLTNNNKTAPSGYTMTVDQTGVYQNTTLKYEHGFNGTVTLDQKGAIGSVATSDITL